MAGALLSGQVEDLEVRCATASDTSSISEVLTEATRWLQEKGKPLWSIDLFSAPLLKPHVIDGEYWMFFYEGELAGVLRFQLEDRLYWPDSIDGEAAYLHKLVVRRAFSGSGLSATMLQWAVKRTKELGRPFLRLDCEASRDRLRGIYEDFGFRRVGDIELDGRIMARFQLEILK